ncbi:MAG: zinc ribbon domain-containing protein [Burkholderiales bacterium]|nr:zinc ribbon domain-containing protein [Burkholderiales bacterium]
MAFEYSTQGATFDFPNPYRIENQFLAARGAVLLIAGVLLLVLAREAGAQVSVQRASLAQGAFVLLVVGGAVLALLGILEFAHAARQLRVFFGRGQPPSLAGEVARDKSGTGAGAQVLVEQLRHGAIALVEPHGALNGILYSVARHLVTAPPMLREYVQVRFANLLAAGGLLVLFLITLLVTPNPAAQALAALVYLVLGSVLILRTYLAGPRGTVALGPVGLAVLLVFGLVGTVLIGRVAGSLPQPAWLVALSLPRIALVLLLASVIIEALGFVAGQAHVDEPPPASTANDQAAVSFNADPNLLMQEVDRELQRRWTQNIPNRRYIWQPPVVEPTREAGNFTGVALEETQPMPPQAVRRMDWGTCLAFPRFYWLAALDALGLLLTAVGAGLWLYMGRALSTGLPESWAPASIGFIFIVVGGYGVRVAHLLWGRLDFESTLTWLDLSGSFSRAQIGLGAQWTDRVRSERSVVNVESMTLRAWVVQSRSVIFSYRDQAIGARTLVGMTGDIDAARAWTQQVRQFAHAQSSVVVPGAGEDARRLQQLSGANQLAGLQAPMPPILPGAAAAPAAPAAAAPGLGHVGHASARHCTACGAALAADSRFCGRCGTPAAAGGGGDVDLTL